MKYLVILFYLAMALVPQAARRLADWSAKLDLQDGDRVAFIGNTFIEREQVDCYIETMLTTRFPQNNITFRNLGYSADTVTGSARGLCAGWSTFEGPDKAFDRLRKLVAEFKPTIVLMNYGMTESFSGPAGLPTFIANYNKMLDALTAAAGAPLKIVLMSPNYHEDMGRPLPDPAEHNKNLRLFRDAIATIAVEHKAAFIDLFAMTEAAAKSPATRLTWNGIHFTPEGYWRISRAIEQNLDNGPRKWDVTIKAADPLATAATGTKLSHVSASPTGAEFTATDQMLPMPPAPPVAAIRPAEPAAAESLEGTIPSGPPDRLLRVAGLQPGKYELKANNQVIATATAEQWAAGIKILSGPAYEQAEKLRKLIVAKNFDFFNYQRPDNDSYILAFRKGEQGRNAVEIPRFLPLVTEKEKEIATLRVPRPVSYTLTAVK